jgi:hypothetical protein
MTPRLVRLHEVGADIGCARWLCPPGGGRNKQPCDIHRQVGLARSVPLPVLSGHVAVSAGAPRTSSGQKPGRIRRQAPPHLRSDWCQGSFGPAPSRDADDRLRGQADATTTPASLHDGLAGASGHPVPETMLPSTLPVIGLEGALHLALFFVARAGRGCLTAGRAASGSGAAATRA